ncbi:hypothetical protein KIL84_009558 [Mauremys mutica]|uniref:Uncharacterized protein n=1 Tax=Mauremys mutica TaxID=74926 RepID=A0A9D3XJN3_9SAUR|nr:hypothetical protein KIL84_009558 [Mauremys mutica]
MARPALALSDEAAKERLGSTMWTGASSPLWLRLGPTKGTTPSGHQLGSLFWPHGRGDGLEMLVLGLVPWEMTVNRAGWPTLGMTRRHLGIPHPCYSKQHSVRGGGSPTPLPEIVPPHPL